jgi:hypothetical protein
MAAGSSRSLRTNLEVACGDMHLSSFGLFGSTERN